MDLKRGASGRGSRRGRRARGVFRGVIADVPAGQLLETPLHPKRKRILPAKVDGNYPETSWSSTTTTAAATTPTLPSPAKKPEKSSHLHPPENNENINIFNYGSEEDSEEDDDEDVPSVACPKQTRLFLQDVFGADGEVSSVNTVPCFTWPPPPLSALPTAALSPSALLPTLLKTSPTASPLPPSESSPLSVKSEIVEVPEKWEFQWREFPQPPVPPTTRREKFDSSDCGPRSLFSSPYEAFTSIWTRDIMQHIATESNRYAQEVATAMLNSGNMRPNSRITQWQDTTSDELYLYLAVILATGVTVKSRIEEYWNKSKDIFSTPGFSRAMTIDRFFLLNKCLHFQNNAGINTQTMSRPEAKLYKLKPILDHLNEKFSSLYRMKQNIALDESLTQWKGWLDINQFIQNKVAGVGIKTFEVCESCSGYLWRLEIHAGADSTAASQEETPVSGFIPATVLRLLRGLEGQGYTVWMDNYYNSPALARELKCLGFDCAGTLRTNRQFVPMELTNLEKADMVPGQIVGCTSGDVDIMVWMDKNRVASISTYHGLATCEVEGVLKPTVIQDYNICMGGVDRKDQMLALYPIERKRTHVWYKKFFRRLLNTSVLNAYIMYRHNHPAMTHRQFRRSLTETLLEKHLPPPPPESLPQFTHFPAEYPRFKAAPGKRSEPLRRSCKVCKKRTTVYCEGCDVPLCLFSCFKQHHIHSPKKHAHHSN